MCSSLNNTAHFELLIVCSLPPPFVEPPTQPTRPRIQVPLQVIVTRAHIYLSSDCITSFVWIKLFHQKVYAKTGAHTHTSKQTTLCLVCGHFVVV